MAASRAGSGARNALVLLIVLVAAAVTVAVALRTGPRGRPDGDEVPVEPRPPRRLERAAPQRGPIVLERTETAGGVVHAIVHLPAEADTYVASGWPEQSFGLDPLYLGYDQMEDFAAQRVLLRFDIVNNIPGGAVINDARLRMHLNYSLPEDDAPMHTVGRQLFSPWAETTVMWGSLPTWGPVRTEARIGSDLLWYEWNVTGLVRDWASRDHENHGMEIVGDERVQQRERAFYARETTTSLYPHLIVDYTDYDDEVPPAVRVNPLPDYVVPDFSVSWTGDDHGGSGVTSYDVQYRVNGGEWIDWQTDVTYETAEFTGGEDGRTYEFRARGEDRARNVGRFGDAEASTTVDSEPPMSQVDALPSPISERVFTVSWNGHDHGSGIWYFDLRYRLNGGDWVPWQQQTLASSATFVAMLDGTYDFEVRAVDRLGLEEAFTGSPEASTRVDARVPFGQP